MNNITFVYPYYNAPHMLDVHLINWIMIPDDLIQHILLIIVDDGSQGKSAFDVIQKRINSIKIRCELYRILDDIPWNQHGARNLGASMAPMGWVFLSDIDHTLPIASIKDLITMDLDPNCYYTLQRTKAARNELGGVGFKPMLDRMGNPKPHANTFLLTREIFWKAGGYDEDYCGSYGGDASFLRWLDRTAKHIHLEKTYVVRWSRAIIADASLPPEFREQYRSKYKALFEVKGGYDAPKPSNWLRFRWERVL